MNSFAFSLIFLYHLRMLADSSTSAYVRNLTFLVTRPIIIMGTDMSTLLPIALLIV